MRRSIAILLPLLVVLASCGTTAQYSQQRFQDGIYGGTISPAGNVHIYSVEEFEAMAAANIAREAKEKDTVVVVVNDMRPTFEPWLFWGSTAWAFSYPYRWYGPYWYGWGYHGWYDPWYAWYDPWYYPWHYPWHYDPWFHGPWGPGHIWHDPIRPGLRPVRPGLSPDGNRYYGARRFTQSGGSTVSRPGSGPNYRGSYSGSYGSAGASMINRRTTTSGTSVTRPSSSGVSGSSSNPVRNGNYNFQRGYGSSSGNNSGSSVNGFLQNSGSSSTRSSGSFNSNSGGSTSRSYGGGGGFSGGGSSMRSGGGGSSTRGGGGRR